MNVIDNFDDIDLPELPEEFDRLPVFAVGGWVRDIARGADPNDIDLMVAEVTPEEMRERGFTEIDNQDNETFAVFLDSLGREVAIAREESPSDEGDNPHTAFKIDPVPPSVPASEAVERDLRRRDFTINAIAFDIRHETVHDPHGGLGALTEETIRHVSDNSFRDDPLRILRGARFAARLDFEIDDATKGAMWESVAKLPELPQERVRMEMENALVEADRPSRFFRVLDEVAALDYTFPELFDLKEEGTAFNHTMMVLDEMSEIRPTDELALLMALTHDLGKGEVDEMTERLSFSNEQTTAAKEAVRFHMNVANIEELRASTVINMVETVTNDARLVDLVKADSLGREPQVEFDRSIALKRFARASQAIDEWHGQRLIDEGYSPEKMGGEEFGNLLQQKRVERMRELESEE